MALTMADLRGLRRSAVRFFSPVGAFLVLFCAVVLVAVPATPSSAATKDPLPIPPGFRLPASNGYTLSMIAVPPHAGRPAYLLIFASAKNKGASYLIPAKVTETSIQADLGELGEIAVTFQRTNQPATARCGKETVRFDSGQYEGKIDFHGEEGYTSVEATAVPGNINYLLSAVCGGSFIEGGSSGRSRGAALYVRNPGLGPRLKVSKSRPGAAAEITASTFEYNNGISIERFANLRMPGEDFTYDRRLRTATVRPPAPFTGSARFDRGKKAGQRWSGNLAVDLPGATGVPLTGPALRATLSPSS
jgi:hypothetical protein